MTTKQINYPHLASMVFNTPLLATVQLRDAVQQALLPRLMRSDAMPVGVGALAGGNEDNAAAISMSTRSGVAVIPVHGIMTTRISGVEANCMEITSYERLSGLLDAALADNSVEQIVLDINTPGGAAVGCFDFAERVYQARAVKPITAIVNYSAYSAGYMIASAASEIIVSSTSGVGSIGVIASHVDLSKMLADDGVTVTTLYRGFHKNDLSPYEPLTDSSAAALNAELDDLYALFVDSVARNRGLKTAAVQGTEAGLFRGSNAITAGLADILMYPQDAVDMVCKRKTSGKPQAAAVPKRVGMQAAAMQMKL